jgi:predicted  nucleic acid-binding Zn-ribbon protein
MKIIVRSILVASVTAVVLVGTFGCNNKVAQCNKLIDKVNASMTKMDESAKKLDGNDDAKDLVELGKSLDTAKKEIDGIEISDAKLKGMQGQFVKSVDNMAASAKAMSAGIEKSDVAAVKAASAQLEASGKENSKLTDDINKYCTGTP